MVTRRKGEEHMILAHLSDKEKACFCSLLLAAVTEDQNVSEGEMDALVRYRIELGMEDLFADLSYEAAVSWLEHNSSERVKRSILLELISVMGSDKAVTGEESDFLSDVARRFKIKNLPAYIKAGEAVNMMYEKVTPLFDGLDET